MPGIFTPKTLVRNAVDHSWYVATSKWQYAEAAMRLATRMVAKKDQHPSETRELALELLVLELQKSERH